MEEALKPGERLDDLQFMGLRIIQHPKTFRFGMDAVLLADFCHVRPSDRVADLGTGTGILPLLLAGRAERAVIDGFEIQAEPAAMAARSVALNGLAHRITIHAMDLRCAPDAMGKGQSDLVVCNPPYGRQGCSSTNPGEELRLARHEGGCTLTEVAYTAKLLLKNGGRLALVLTPARLLELMDILRENKLEPKRLRMVYPDAGKPPCLVLLEGVKSARPGLHCLPPLMVHDGQGNPTPEMDRIYHRI